MMWRPIEAKIAKIKYGLMNGDIVSSELSSEIALSAFNISITTRTERDRVDAFIFPDVKYEHGLFAKSCPSIKLTGENSSFGHDGH
jgi:hypothetical protein